MNESLFVTPKSSRLTFFLVPVNSTLVATFSTSTPLSIGPRRGRVPATDADQTLLSIVIFNEGFNDSMRLWTVAMTPAVDENAMPAGLPALIFATIAGTSMRGSLIETPMFLTPTPNNVSLVSSFATALIVVASMPCTKS